MRNFKKFLTLVLAVMMVVSSFAFSTSAATTKFEDVDAKNETLVNAVDLLAYVGVTKGVSETKFGADELVTREQFALFMYRLLKGGKDAPANAANTTNFKDLEDKTYFYAISWANGMGIVNGKSDVAYGPKDPITLQEAYTMVVRALDYEKVEELVYPYGYIEVAEKLGVELDKGLDSDLNYEDKLTRADMAIILYNAFFAETAIAEVIEVERGVGQQYDFDGTTWVPATDANGDVIYADYVMEEKETYPRLCEKAFDVYELNYQVVATPNYYYNGVAGGTAPGYAPTFDLGYEAAYLNFVGADLDAKDLAKVPSEVYLEPADLGVEEGALDETFLGEYKLFVTLDDDDQIDEVLFADCDMVKKTVTEFELGTVSTNKAASYYTDAINGGIRGNKLLSGKITAGDVEIYAFNAPYNYAKNAYTQADSTEVLKYGKRNEENIDEIKFYLDPTSDENNTIYFAEESAFVSKVATDANTDGAIDDPFFTAEANTLLTKFDLVYSEGLYEADLYDVDGDGLYDYIDYKPYTFFQVDSDEDYELSDSLNVPSATAGNDVNDVDYASTESTVPYIYTNGATLLGADFEDEDFVIGYVDFDTNTVKVAEVVKPTVATIKNFKEATGEIVLANGDKLDAVNAYKFVKNVKPVDNAGVASTAAVFDAEAQVLNQITAAAAAGKWADSRIGDEVEFYAYNGVVLFDKAVDANIKFTENLIIPTTLAGTKEVKDTFNPEAGDITTYVYAWIDGETKYIPVETEDVFPAVVAADGVSLTADYESKLCTYEYANGVYTLIALAADVDDLDGTYIGVNNDPTVLAGDDETAQYITNDANVGFTKVIGSRFTLGSMSYDLEFKSYTKVIVRTNELDVHGNTVYKFLELDAADFTADMANPFTSVEFVVANNPDSIRRENLVVMYAEIAAADFDFVAETDRTDYRIISSSEKDIADDEYYFNYVVFNPFTGKKETVKGKKTSNRAAALATTLVAGDLVEIEDGFVNDKNTAPIINNVAALTDSLVWISEFDTADDYMVVAPVSQVAPADANCKECLKDALEAYAGGFDGIDYDGTDYRFATNFVKVTDDTVVTVVKYDSLGSLFNYGTMELADVDVLANPTKDYLCYNDACVDKNNNLFTGYADYLKAYVAVEDKDPTAAEELEAEFVMIVVTNGDASALDKTYNTPCNAGVGHN